jgi:hypothetical protein
MKMLLHISTNVFIEDVKLFLSGFGSRSANPTEFGAGYTTQIFAYITTSLFFEKE